MMRHADYYFKILDNVLVIYDLNRGNKSVTNDVEYVLQELWDKGLLNEPRKIVYQDSMGKLDEIKIDENGNFKGFSILTTSELESFEQIIGFD